MPGLILFFGAFIFYLISLAPTVTAGDSGNLAAAAAVLGIGHPPGYPLYCLIGKIFTLLLPYGNIAYRTNLMSAFFVSVSLYGIFLIIKNFYAEKLSGLVIGTAVIASFAFSSSLAKTAVNTEVFALNTFWAVIIIFAITKITAAPVRTGGRLSFFYLLCFLFGLGLGNQHTLLLFSPGILLATLFFFWRCPKKIIFSGLLIGLTFFVLGLSVYLYLPIRSHINPPLDWENPETVKSFWKLVTRARYGSFQIAQGGKTAATLSALWSQLFFSKDLLVSQIGIPGLILGLAGFFYLRNWVFLLFFLISGPAFVFLANLSPGEASIAILERFQILPSLVLIISAAVFLLRFQQKFKFIVLLLPLFFWRPGFSEIYQRNNFLVYDYGKDILRTLPENARLFSDRADEIEFSLAYLQLAEKKRTDLTIVDCNAGVFYNIYGNDYYGIWGPKRLAIREKIEKQIIAQSEQPVYYASLDLKQIPELVRIPQGLIYFAPQKSNETLPYFDYSQIYTLRIADSPDYRSAHLAATYPYLLAQYFLSYDRKEKTIEECR
ncbi:MAG: DUF2723 domain-containing protein [Elusimicrobiota bacterium]